MLQFEVKGDILFVFGDEIEGDYRTNLKKFLHSAEAATASCPVQQGTHDFWITYGSTGDPNHGFEDMSIKPRPLRGIIEMGEIDKDRESTDTDEKANAGEVSTMLQEVAHHWVVPPDLSIKNEAFWPSTSFRPYKFPGRDEISLSLEEGTPYYGCPVGAGRDNRHWSFFFKADQSVLDGMDWKNDVGEDGYQVWKQSIVPQPSATPDGLNPIVLEGRYNDLDLFLMGVKNATEAYDASNSTFEWFQPRFTAPLNYFAGLFVAFSRYDFFYFGFYRDHRKVATWDSRVPDPHREFPLPGYRPLANEFNSVGFRIVRRSSDYYFQAKLYGPTRSEDLLEGIDPIGPIGPGGLDNFRTLDKLSNSDEPMAMGLIVKTKTKNLILCDAAFFNIKVLDARGNKSVFSPKEIPPSWNYPASDDFSTLPEYGKLVFNNPVKKARIRLGPGWPNNQWIYLTTRYATISDKGLFEDTQSYDHSDDPANPKVDEAPKVLTRVPPGNENFAVATAARINRSSCCPWAGLPDPVSFPDLSMWGKAGSATSYDVVFSEKSLTKQSLPDVTGTYKFAFILVSKENTWPDRYNKEAQRIDIIRRYWDDAFEKLTLGRRHSYSKLK